ncbi:arylesterase [Reichenbachiella carrageenanivorans]|uniref:Arylesterase n=1 Tax=Reichenbachiella carrageenanivorans TaxID=2979869 RepID=A0ABY6D533_9BACT|nr:arylesterase [Reichenbachiella carrageenanivorans]UXX80730.1 arylesterase [Reichenbachiella carrageenanivorans]
MNWSIILVGFVFLMSCQSQKKETNTPIASSETAEQVVQPSSKKTILFFGNSITAGYKLDLSEAFPALIQERLDSLGLGYRTVNAGLSGETTASGNSRVEWVMKNPMDIFVLELGANDGLRGISTAETEKNLSSIIEKVKQKYPTCKIILAGMMIPPNMGQEYADSFQQIYPALAEKYQIPLIPFLLEGVAGDPALNLEDGIHPTPEGHQILAENVWQVLVTIL